MEKIFKSIMIFIILITVAVMFVGCSSDTQRFTEFDGINLPEGYILDDPEPIVGSKYFDCVASTIWYGGIYEENVGAVFYNYDVMEETLPDKFDNIYAVILTKKIPITLKVNGNITNKSYVWSANIVESNSYWQLDIKEAVDYNDYITINNGTITINDDVNSKFILYLTATGTNGTLSFYLEYFP